MDFDQKNWKKIREGSTDFLIYKDSDRIYDASVFYNPKMTINRDFTLLVLSALKDSHSKEMSFLDPFAGTGVRSYRILNELPKNSFSGIHASDRNLIAYDILKRNKEEIFQSDKLEISCSDANDKINEFIHQKPGIDVIDIDPFGSPIEFIYSSLKALQKTEGFLFLTATDLQVLCGKFSESCLRIYNSIPTRNYLCHEVALRILFYNLLISAGRLGLYIEPILAFHYEHFLRLKVRVKRNKEESNKQHQQIGFVYFCTKCSFLHSKTFMEVSDQKKCPVCSKNLEKAGPLWLGQLNSKSKIDSFLKILSTIDLPTSKSIEKLLTKLQEEIINVPFFFYIPYISRSENKKSISIQKVIELLRERKFLASRSAFDPEGIKTNASFEELRTIIRTL